METGLILFVVVLLASTPFLALYLSRRANANQRREQQSKAVQAAQTPRTEIRIPRRAVSTGRPMPVSSTQRVAVADSPLWIDPVVLANYGNYHQPSSPAEPAPAHFESGGGDFGGGGASASYDSSSCDSGGSSDSGSCGGGGGD